MHIAYSALNNPADPARQNNEQNESEILLRYRAYQTACKKYRDEIAAIQKYIPGWVPRFR